MSLSLEIRDDIEYGNEVRKFDQANRLVIPKDFRNRFGDKIVLSKDINGVRCIYAYSKEEYAQVYRNISRSYSGTQIVKVQNKLSACTITTTIDKGGRITLRDDFIKFAGLVDEALVVNQPDKMCIWNPKIWEEENEKISEDIDFGAFNASPYQDD